MDNIVSLLKQLDELSKSRPYTMELYSSGHCELLDGDGYFVLSATTIDNFVNKLENEVAGFRYHNNLEGSTLCEKP